MRQVNRQSVNCITQPRPESFSMNQTIDYDFSILISALGGKPGKPVSFSRINLDATPETVTSCKPLICTPTQTGRIFAIRQFIVTCHCFIAGECRLPVVKVLILASYVPLFLR